MMIRVLEDLPVLIIGRHNLNNIRKRNDSVPMTDAEEKLLR